MFQAYVVCTSMFPLCAGRVMSDRLALIFVWGIIFVDDLSYVPPDLTFFYGVISIAFVVGPLLLVLVRGFQSRSSSITNESIMALTLHTNFSCRQTPLRAPMRG